MPVLKSSIPKIIQLTQTSSLDDKESSVGEELEELAADIGLRIGAAILDEFKRARDVIDA
jgi:hypothetical protein